MKMTEESDKHDDTIAVSWDLSTIYSSISKTVPREY